MYNNLIVWVFFIVCNLRCYNLTGGEAAKHFLSGDYIRDPREKEKVFGKRATGHMASGSTGYMTSGNTGHMTSGSTGHMATGSAGHMASGSTGQMASGGTGYMTSGSTGQVNHGKHDHVTKTSFQNTSSRSENIFDNLTLKSLDPERIRR